MNEGEALRRQAEIDELRTWFLEGRLAHADRSGEHQCTIEDCSRPTDKAVWLADDEDAPDVNLCRVHFDEVTRQ
jgi:hypothetical protein